MLACWLDFYDTQTSHLAFALDSRKENARIATLTPFDSGDPRRFDASSCPSDQRSASGTGLRGDLAGYAAIACEAPGLRRLRAWTRSNDTPSAAVRGECRIRPQSGVEDREMVGILGASHAELPCPAIFVRDGPGVPAWESAEGLGSAPCDADAVAGIGIGALQALVNARIIRHWYPPRPVSIIRVTPSFACLQVEQKNGGVVEKAQLISRGISLGGRVNDLHRFPVIIRRIIAHQTSHLACIFVEAECQIWHTHHEQFIPRRCWNLGIRPMVFSAG